MAGLQRSSETFRRSGSSGLVWDDKKEIKPPAGDGGKLDRSRSAGHAHGHAGYRAAGLVPPALDPPSPRVAGCGFWSIFGGGGGGKGKGKGASKGKAKGRRH
ncbi:MAPK kinase substrate protein At1g80180-like [Panicum virgatum]|uniref:Uncharacterized protein n=1 Tax=Panicum virgatum TaxID=38727 RepID=A0A8T0UPN6_PANVG|nr:MAPK kinase substrate protein At1g80180-like [Panicum virgatum]KAG2626071.1 hypothetical protein PVAP13_3KG286000 [Panicum virgatum]